MLVDDSTAEQFALREVLRGAGYRVATATDGRQGYELAQLTRPALILLDVVMAGMGGFAACRLLKADVATAAIPVIFLSGADSETERVDGLRLGAVDFVGKPFSARELLARIEIHLRLAAAEGRVAAAPAGAGNDDAALPADANAATALAMAPAPHDDTVLAEAARHYIDEHLAEHLQLDDVAHCVGSYRERLSRAFQTRFGMTVFAYLRDQRILRGAAMLRETGAGIGEIAAAVGFSSAGNFATAFRNRMGATPGDYRRGRGAAPGAQAGP